METVERKVVELYNEKGNKSQKVLIALKNQVVAKLKTATAEDLELLDTERNTLAIDTGLVANDKNESVVYAEISVSITTKPLSEKTKRGTKKETPKEEPVVPSIFG